MATPEKGADAEVRPEGQPAPEVKPDEPVIPDTPDTPPSEKELDGKIPEWDPRKAIYEKTDAIKAEAEAAEAAQEEPAQETPPEEKPPEEKPPETPDEVLSLDDALALTKGKKFKLKIAGEEVVVGFEDLTKATGLEAHLTKKSMAVSDKAKELDEKERQLTAQQTELLAAFENAGNLKVTPAPPSAYRYWTEDQVDAKYDELHAESPSKAMKFRAAVDADRQTAAQDDRNVQIDRAVADFKSDHPQVTKDDWLKIHDPKWHQQFPDVMRAVRQGNVYAALTAAYSHISEERINAKLAQLDADRKSREKDAQDRIEAKKKGQVLRTPAKATPKGEAKKGEEERETPEQYARRVAQERRGLQGRGPLTPKF